MTSAAGIGQLVSEHGAGAREHLAYQAMGEWSSDEREALRTLAAASPEIRSQALGNMAETGDQQDGWTPVGVANEDAAGEQQRSSAPFGATPPASRPQSPGDGSSSQPRVDLPDASGPAPHNHGG